MQNSIDVVFKGMDRSKEIEAEVGAWMLKLRSLSDAAGMMSGQIVVESMERTGAQRHSGRRFSASVALATLDADVMVARDQDGNAAHEDVYVSVRNAFRALRRRLETDNERRLATSGEPATL
jgi:hypothetical protein